MSIALEAITVGAKPKKASNLSDVNEGTSGKASGRGCPALWVHRELIPALPPRASSTNNGALEGIQAQVGNVARYIKLDALGQTSGKGAGKHAREHQAEGWRLQKW